MCFAGLLGLECIPGTANIDGKQHERLVSTLVTDWSHLGRLLGFDRGDAIGEDVTRRRRYVRVAVGQFERLSSSPPCFFWHTHTLSQTKCLSLNLHHNQPTPITAAVVEVRLEPFQILFLTSSDDDTSSANPQQQEIDMSSNDSFDKMTLLSVTREHLVENEFSKHDFFIYLSLYQTIRSDEQMFANGTHVAFTGTAHYSEPVMTHEQMEEIEYMCFLGENEEIYVERLREMGWRNLERALLMTAGGDMVEFRDGTMVMVDMSSSDGGELAMDNDTSMMLYFVAVFVPVGVVVFAVLSCIVYVVRNSVAWKKSSDPNGLAWQADPSKAKKLRRMTLEIRNGDDTSSAASGLTDVPSVKAAVAAPRRASGGGIPPPLSLLEQGDKTKRRGSAKVSDI